MAIDFQKAAAALDGKPIDEEVVERISYEIGPEEPITPVITGQPYIQQTPATPKYPVPWEQKKILLENLCKDLKDERNRQNISQRELAQRSGYSQGTITRAETRGWISISALLAITAALGKAITIK